MGKLAKMYFISQFNLLFILFLSYDLLFLRKEFIGLLYFSCLETRSHLFTGLRSNTFDISNRLEV